MMPPMIRIAALVRAHWQVLRTYRMKTLLSLVSMVATVVPLYFVANAVQPIMAGSIRAEGGNAFGFLVVGLATFMLVSASITALPQVVSDRISSGVLEALLATPTSAGELLVGLNLFDLLITALRVTILFIAAGLLGAAFIPSAIPRAVIVLVLIVAAHVPFGLIGTAMVLAFRSAGPLPRAIVTISGLLGGVYYPTTVVPSWLRAISNLLPLSYGLRALRRVLLQHATLTSVAPDLLALVVANVLLFALGAAALSAALRHARLQGTLAQY